MSSEPKLICRASKWIKLRAVLIILMFSVFSYLFYKDGVVGYREKNVEYVMYQLFTKVAPAKAASEGMTEDKWREYVMAATLPETTEEEAPLPKDFDRNQKWPAALAENFDLLVTTSDGGKALWIDYTEEMGWGETPPEELHDQGSLNTQIYLAWFCGGLAVLTTGMFLRTLTRSMYVTEDAYVAPGGTVVPFSAMTRIDKRKWENKGVAVIEYSDGGVKKKVKVDGMVYGHFDKAEDEPAERLFEYVMKHFKGEVLEYEVEAQEENA